MTSLDLLKLSLDADTTNEELLLSTISFLNQPDLAKQPTCFKQREKICLDSLGLYLSPVPVQKKYKQLPLTKDNIINVLTKHCCGKDEMLQAMTGVYFDAERGVAVATDAHKLCIIPFEVSETELLRKGRFEHERIDWENFPKYNNILRKGVKKTDIKPFDHDLVLSQIEGALLMLKFILRPVGGILLRFGENVKIDANAEIVYGLLVALKLLGQTVDGIVFDSSEKSIELYNGKNCVGAFMPVLASELGLRVAIQLT